MSSPPPNNNSADAKEVKEQKESKDTKVSKDVKDSKPVKLAPAPVPQASPWKQFQVEAYPVEGRIEQEAAQNPPSEMSKFKETLSKRATTGKEKWVILEPQVPAPVETPQTFSKNSKPKKKQGSKGGRNDRGGKPRRANSKPGSNGSHGPSSHVNHSSHNTQGTQGTHGNHGNHGTQSSQGSPATNGSPSDKNANSGSISASTSAGSGANPSGHSNATSTPNAPNPSPNTAPKDHRRPFRKDREGEDFDSRRDRKYTSKPYKTKPRYQQQYYGQPNYRVPMVYPAQSAENVLALVIGQMAYYFSIDNLCKDIFLRRNMDDNGFVPISVLAAFNRVKAITQDPELVVQACNVCPVTELNEANDKVRAAEGWERWIVPKENRLPSGLN